MELITKNAEETKKLGQKLAADLVIKDGPLVLALSGDLGSGKTTFVQGFAEGLGIRQRIISPTFILLRKYEKNFYHLDLYRLDEDIEQEVRNLGLEEIWKDRKNIVVIEWAEKIKEMTPDSATWVKFENLGKDERKITIAEK